MPIEQVRTLLVFALLLILFLMWQAWQEDYARPREPQPTATSAADLAPTRPDVPDAPAPAFTEPDLGSPALPLAAERDIADALRVETDVLSVDIDPNGGNIIALDLLAYPVSAERPETPFRLLSPDLPEIFIAQSGLLGDVAAPNHHAAYSFERREYRLQSGEEELLVPLYWQDESGVQVTKIFHFRRDSYLIGVSYVVENAAAEPWTARAYGQFQRQPPVETGGLFRTYTYTGGVISNDETPYEKIDFSEMAKSDLNRSIPGGWAAMIQHYFVGAWIPDQASTNHYYTKALPGSRYVLGVIAPPVTVAPGEDARIELPVYVGPKIQQRLETLAPRLELTVDYGWLTIIAEPLHWILSYIHRLVGNWGWSIILLTLLIKLLFFQLSAASYKSMARMRKLQPRVLALRERYGSDKARMNQAMMDLYKTEKINPLGGCLPILVQIPVFIALYWVLLESVELRQAEFIFWLNDLSVYDPYFVLPILMGVSMLVQTKLNPTPPDPIQAKVMMALPFVFTFFFLFFPSGLVLYWFVNNVLSIAQQWVITKRIVSEKS